MKTRITFHLPGFEWLTFADGGGWVGCPVTECFGNIRYMGFRYNSTIMTLTNQGILLAISLSNSFHYCWEKYVVLRMFTV